MKLRMKWWDKKIHLVFLVTGMLLPILGCSIPGQTLPTHSFLSVPRMGISGMVRVAEDAFLIVTDEKQARGHSQAWGS
ncbi:MAG: hypothetical protein OEY80_01555, partial [Nitrospirota bacterium]|jgi:hypothetical protein|nr:hypothetical protein [Nitrospirota bacterium]MDH4361793.1 hypothetical protein [Nitrospirota bacterium]MDH5574149.1 hypothetical protein [Nitrospirota bacterium]